MIIQELTLYTENLQLQKDFYCDVLGIPLYSSTDHSFGLSLGASLLYFEEKKDATPYHFAINIPAHSDQKALEWLKARVPILKDGEHEIQDFDFWNAKAVYFYDEDKNIVEFIARNNLDNANEDEFSAKSLLSICEIGVPTSSILPIQQTLEKALGLPIFSGSVERFCAIGDEYGLFISIDRNNRDWFPVNDPAFPSPFKISVMNEEKNYELEYLNEKILLKNQPQT